MHLHGRNTSNAAFQWRRLINFATRGKLTENGVIPLRFPVRGRVVFRPPNDPGYKGTIVGSDCRVGSLLLPPLQKRKMPVFVYRAGLSFPLPLCWRRPAMPTLSTKSPEAPGYGDGDGFCFCASLHELSVLGTLLSSICLLSGSTSLFSNRV